MTAPRAPIEWEITVGGPIGPAALSHLPGLTPTTVPPSTVLAGSIPDTTGLLDLMTLLADHGIEPIDIRITRGPQG